MSILGEYAGQAPSLISPSAHSLSRKGSNESGLSIFKIEDDDNASSLKRKHSLSDVKKGASPSKRRHHEVNDRAPNAAKDDKRRKKPSLGLDMSLVNLPSDVIFSKKPT